MKKILIISFILFSFVFSVSITNAKETTQSHDNNLKLVNSIGHKLLDSSNLPTQVEFRVADEDHINAYANIKGEVYVYSGLIKFVENDEELAGVIGHEIGHIVNRHTHKQTILNLLLGPIKKSVTYISDKLWISKLVEYIGMASLMKVSRNDEHEADITGADLMIKAGYNPLAMISLLNKITENHLDIMSTHPSGDKRLVYLYDYLAYNYPEYVDKTYSTESYTEFKTYMTEITKQRLSNPSEMEKYLKKQKKLREERLECLSNIQKNKSPWEYPFKFLAPQL